MASTIRTIESELKIAKLMQVDEWFDLYSGLFPLGVARVSMMLRGFLCVTKKRRSRSLYYITRENKARLIECIKQNPQGKGFDITLTGERCDDMWHKLLGTKQGVKHEEN